MAARKRMTKAQKEYREKLRDPRWQKLRLEVLEAAAWRCGWCNADEENLQVHHGYYRRGLNPWEYPPASLWVLCNGCHEHAESLKRQLAELQGLIGPWFHHHIYYYMQDIHTASNGGIAIQRLEPKKPD